MEKISDNTELFAMLFKEDFTNPKVLEHIQNKMVRQGWTVDRVLEQYEKRPVKSIHRILNTPYSVKCNLTIEDFVDIVDSMRMYENYSEEVNEKLSRMNISDMITVLNCAKLVAIG